MAKSQTRTSDGVSDNESGNNILAFVFLGSLAVVGSIAAKFGHGWATYVGGAVAIASCLLLERIIANRGKRNDG
jgi:hypothetical protein